MSLKTATARYDGSGLRFSARSGSGHTVVVDNVAGNAGPRPMELVLLAQAGCTGMDVISILQKKRQPVSDYEVQVSAEQRAEHPQVYTRLDVVHEVRGSGLDEEAVRRAIELSATKYCSVAAMLSAGPVEIHHRYRILSGEADAIEGEVLVTGPGADPSRLGQPSGNAPVA